MNYTLAENEYARLVWDGKARIQVKDLDRDFLICTSLKQGWKWWCSLYGKADKAQFIININNMVKENK